MDGLMRVRGRVAVYGAGVAARAGRRLPLHIACLQDGPGVDITRARARTRVRAFIQTF
jgi:hypothetical protein